MSSPASQIDFLDEIDFANYFESSDNGELTGDEYLSHIEAADVSENSEDMPALVNVLDSSDDESVEISGTDINSNGKNNENNLYEDLPELEEIFDSSDDKDSYMEDIYNATNDFPNFLDEADKTLAVDTLGEAYTTTYGCATLVNAAGINDGVGTVI